ncbi:MAG: DUF4868 domain-containing protein [Candidatus Contendobacter sp.]|nr:DUF4868 domain-containing protein [Candidatus Contendobacter sp.]
MPFNLFAIASSSGNVNKTARFKLSKQVQDELTTYLKSQEQQFNDSIEKEIKFDGKYKPDQGEVLVVDHYDNADNLGQAIRNPLGIEEIEPSNDAFRAIKALCTGYVDADGKVVVLIQNFDKRKIISTDGLSIFHSANTYKKIDGMGITLDTKLSAILKGKTLRFYSFHALRQIFDFSAYYREATDQDISDFASQATIKVADLAELVKISDSWIRKKISLIQQSRILETVPMRDIKEVAKQFDIPLRTVTEQGNELIMLPTKKAELKTILRFLDEDYFTSPISKTRYITNSKRVVRE